MPVACIRVKYEEPISDLGKMKWELKEARFFFFFFGFFGHCSVLYGIWLELIDLTSILFKNRLFTRWNWKFLRGKWAEDARSHSSSGEWIQVNKPKGLNGPSKPRSMQWAQSTHTQPNPSARFECSGESYKLVTFFDQFDKVLEHFSNFFFSVQNIQIGFAFEHNELIKSLIHQSNVERIKYAAAVAVALSTIVRVCEKNSSRRIKSSNWCWGMTSFSVNFVCIIAHFV